MTCIVEYSFCGLQREFVPAIERFATARRTVEEDFLWHAGGGEARALFVAQGALQLSVPVNMTEEELPLSKHAQRASDALRSLGTVMRWGNVFFAGIIALGALFSIVNVLILVILKAQAEAAGAVSVVAVNWDAVLCINLVFWGIAAAFYGMCFFLRLLLREILRTRVRRKGGGIKTK